jgi:hypothetical protein
MDQLIGDVAQAGGDEARAEMLVKPRSIVDGKE